MQRTSPQLEQLKRDKLIAQAIRQVTDMHEEVLDAVPRIEKAVSENKSQLARVLNLPKGDKGDRGEVGPRGIPGRDGKNGTDGKDGYTPVKGKDYFTDSEKEALYVTTLARLKNPKDGKDAVVDEDKIAQAVLDLIKEKKLIGMDHVEGLRPELDSYRHRMAMKQAGQHGGGDTVVAGNNISIVALPNGTKQINATGMGTGSVTDVSVNTANGFSGTVTDPTTTPAISIETTVTGLLLGDGTGVSAATPNTDYQVPIALTTTGSSGAATFDGTTLNIPQYSAGSGGISRSVNSVAVPTNAGSAASTDYVYLVSGTTTITMPTAVGNTNRYTIKRVGTDPVTVAFTGAETGDGSTTLLLNVQYDSLDLISDNTNWNII